MPSDKIKHFICVMMENRSFDHMLGFLKSPNYQINGLNGNEQNPDNQNRPVKVTKDAAISGDLNPDPGHSFEDTAMQIFGFDPGTQPPPPPTMSGFVKNYFTKSKDAGRAARIMKCLSPTTVPIITRLAQEYCVCDNWFSSIPGPTLCNRAYAHAATSIGRVDTGADWHKISKTIYELLRESGVSAKIYYNDFTMALTFPRLIAAQNLYFGKFEDFVDDCRHNRLPSYSFIEPRYYSTDTPAFLPAQDQHPDHNVWAGEGFLRQVYESVRINDEVWNSSLLLITYDEHGGTYDHVPPPSSISPDGINCTDPPFDFSRLGVRVPAILVSPYVEKGAMDHTEYEHSSIVATARKLFLKDADSKFLTERDRLANTFEKNVTRSTPRTDKVDWNNASRGFHALTLTPDHARIEAALPLSEMQKALVEQTMELEARLPKRLQSGIDPLTIRTERQAAQYVQRVNEGLRHAGPIAVKARPAKARAKAARAGAGAGSSTVSAVTRRSTSPNAAPKKVTKKKTSKKTAKSRKKAKSAPKR